jgi:hypothetical protein
MIQKIRILRNYYIVIPLLMKRSTWIYFTFFFTLLLSCGGVNEAANDLSSTEETQTPHRYFCSTTGTASIDNKSIELAAGNKVWKDRMMTDSTLLVYFMEGNSATNQEVLDVANQWLVNSNMQFVESKDIKHSHIRITYLIDPLDTNDRFNSLLGTDADSSHYRNTNTMRLGDIGAITSQSDFDYYVLHEFGHALGFIHEHQRSDAPIVWEESELYIYCDTFYNMDSNAVLDHMIHLIADVGINSSVLDTLSIMIYGFPNSVTKGNLSAPLNVQLSAEDLATIERFYP